MSLSRALGKEEWPLPKFHFLVTFGKEKWAFQEVTGLEAEFEVLEYRHGKSKQLGPFKMSGMPKVSDATLKKGMFKGDTDIFKWFKTNRTKKLERKNVRISLLNEYHIPEIIWTLSNAFPKKIEGPSLNSQSSEVAIESITLSYEELEVDNLLSLGMKLM